MQAKTRRQLHHALDIVIDALLEEYAGVPPKKREYPVSDGPILSPRAAGMLKKAVEKLG